MMFHSECFCAQCCSSWDITPIIWDLFRQIFYGNMDIPNLYFDYMLQKLHKEIMYIGEIYIYILYNIIYIYVQIYA